MRADAVIVGGGIIGCATAYEMAKRGKSVVVLEKTMIGHGGSSRNLGGVRQSARDIRELPLAMYSIREIWPNLTEELGVDIEYVQKGGFRLGENEEEHQLLEMYTERSKRLGLEVYLLPGDEARAICPALSPTITWASWCPSDGHANPYLTTLAYYRKARELGARFITGETVTEIRMNRSRVGGVVTEDGTVYEGDNVLVAAGFASRPILDTVGIDIPMKLCINECMVSEKEEALFPQMMATAHGTFFVNQTGHGSFAFDATREIDPWVDKGEEINTPSSMAAETMSEGIRHYFPQMLDAKVVRQWVGYWDVTPDRVPVVDRAEEVPGLYIACGFSGHGFGLAPGAARLMTAWMNGETLPVDVSGLRHDRFECNLH